MALTLMLTACGTASVRARPGARTLGNAVESQGSRVTEAAALGSSLPFTGDGKPGANPQPWELVAVSRVLERRALKPSGGQHGSAAGYAYLEVHLTIQNVGKPIYRDNPGWETSLVSTETGGYVGTRVHTAGAGGPCANDLLRTIVLHAGQTAHGCVVFSVPRGERVSAVQYKTDGGLGANVATWALDRFAVHG